ncbi:PadR family transcriptional regulator PadR [Streptomyces pseudovenezuelae]|uniref:PadR family transcriptional regulator PadR n=2 Tax=Streptomyces pseudovenezuelae TaxID=67350 RepID=A0ABT6M498_9ACTN|nr:PadR family transcriptional regulator PadR [Streptomyces pseudovenezuelae]
MCRFSVVKMTRTLERVLRAFLEDPAAARYGYDLMKATALQSGTLYPLLARLKEGGLVDAHWETPAEEGQRPRRYYQLSAEGVRWARLELAELAQRRSKGGAGATRPAQGTL